MPRPYLLQVHSQPKHVPKETWTKWYLEEHIRDMVYFHAAQTAAFYRSSSESFTYLEPAEDGGDRMTFVALYQTDRKKCLQYPEFKDHVRQKSQLWNDESLIGRDVGDFAIVDLELVEVLGSYEYNESMAISPIAKSNRWIV